MADPDGGEMGAQVTLPAALETRTMESALRQHYIDHPAAKPPLAEVALVAQHRSPLADRPDLVTAAAAAAAHRRDVDADDVLQLAAKVMSGA